jgi:PST family polysaccharide transporter
MKFFEKIHYKKWLNDKATNQLFKNIFSLAFLQGFNYILPLITIPYLIRVLGAGYFGLISFANATIAYFLIITDYGFNLTATREIAIHSNNHKKICEIFSAVMIIKTVLMCCCFCILILFVTIVDKFNSHANIYIFTFGSVVGQVFFPIWFFQGMEQMKYITYLNVFARIFFTVAIFIFVKDQADYVLVPVLSSSGFIVSGIISLVIVRKIFHIQIQGQDYQTLIVYLKDAWHIFVIDFMPNLYNNFSTFLLGFMVPLETVGYYALATKIIGIFNNLIYVIRNATYPYLSKQHAHFSVILQVTLSAGLFFTIVIVLLSNSMFEMIFGQTIQNSLLYIYILSLSPFLMAISVSFGSNKLLVLKKDREMKHITISFSVFGFCLAILLIPIYGATGAAVTVVLARCLMAFLTYRSSKKYCF